MKQIILNIWKLEFEAITNKSKSPAYLKVMQPARDGRRASCITFPSQALLLVRVWCRDNTHFKL